MQASRSELSSHQVGSRFSNLRESQLEIDAEFSSKDLDTLVQARPKRAVRSQNAIVLAILEACRTPSVQHWIMVKARLGYDTFWTHMNNLLLMGMMETTRDGNKTLYRINAKGIKLLEKLEPK